MGAGIHKNDRETFGTVLYSGRHVINQGFAGFIRLIVGFNNASAAIIIQAHSGLQTGRVTLDDMFGVVAAKRFAICAKIQGF